jgi:hypothetical protein
VGPRSRALPPPVTRAADLVEDLWVDHDRA